MAQLRKAAYKQTRNTNPCVRCGADHPTWQHGKTEEEASQQLLSRRFNPKDPINDTVQP